MKSVPALSQIPSRHPRPVVSVLFGVGMLAAVGCKEAPATQAPEAPAPAEAPTAEPEAPAETAESASLPDRDPVLARRLVREEGAVLLDVRSQAEFDDGHVDGAVLIPHDQLQERLAEVAELAGGDTSKPIVLYCRSGGRAGKAKQVLLDAGYDQVTNLGGLTDWCEDCTE